MKTHSPQSTDVDPNQTVQKNWQYLLPSLRIQIINHTEENQQFHFDPRVIGAQYLLQQLLLLKNRVS